jgi:YHS domain-containing protein
MTKRTIILAGSVLIAAGVAFHASAQQGPTSDVPRYAADGKLERPDNYREWVFLSSGHGMSYSPAAQNAPKNEPPFDNVFVTPAAYRSFMQTGKWPDKTMFVLEVRSAMNKGSINQGGHYQGGVLGLDVEVKDGGKWGFYGYEGASTSAKLMASNASCYTCHSTNGAVDNTFVQFYPTLIEVAQRKGTFKLASAKTETAQAPASEKVFDPVCKMEIALSEAVGKSDYKGKTYHFCRDECKENFDKSPADFVK